jgi:hypothetical protein
LVERPAIFICPLDGCVGDDEIEALRLAMVDPQPGQVIHAAFPVSIYHLIDGLWIESADLHKILVKATDGDQSEVIDELRSN